MFSYSHMYSMSWKNNNAQQYKKKKHTALRMAILPPQCPLFTASRALWNPLFPTYHLTHLTVLSLSNQCGSAQWDPEAVLCCCVHWVGGTHGIALYNSMPNAFSLSDIVSQKGFHLW